MREIQHGCELIDKDGNRIRKFADHGEAADWAEANLAGEQDSNNSEEPDGWYLQTIGAEVVRPGIKRQ